MYPGLSLPAIFTGVANGTLRPALPPDAPQLWCVAGLHLTVTAQALSSAQRVRIDRKHTKIHLHSSVLELCEVKHAVSRPFLLEMNFLGMAPGNERLRDRALHARPV